MMPFSGSRYAAWSVLCGCFFWLGASCCAAQEENALTPPTASPFRDDVLPDRSEQALPEKARGNEFPQSSVQCPTPEQLSEWFKPLNQIKLRSRPVDGRMPIDCSTQLFYTPTGQAASVPERHWANSEFNWVASNLAAQPAYWDDVPLERYGQSVCPLAQPGISGVKFFLTFPIIPYKIGVDRTHDLIYTLGYYRPGSPTPPVRQVLPFEWDAAIFEALAVTGMVFILP
jgi:hypothetical protein